MTFPKKTVGVVFGTRPECIKMAPVILALRSHPRLQPVVISTGQHKQMLDQMLRRFDIKVHHELDLMEPNQSLSRLSSKALTAFESVLRVAEPAMMLVQGDTTTAFLGALSSFYFKIPIGHVEAGLRTFDKMFPFPEEVNRKLISVVSDLNFCPTEGNRQNLLKEGVSEKSIHITGNTGIDTLLKVAQLKDALPSSFDLKDRSLVLITIHRRESFGPTLIGIFEAIRDLASRHPELVFVYPVHLNPNVQGPASTILSGLDNIFLVEPMDYFDFIATMRQAKIILTDSGGVQEEAPTLGIPVLVLRNETERPEALAMGGVKLIGTQKSNIVVEVEKILSEGWPVKKSFPYGDGFASERIVEHIDHAIGSID